MKRLRSYIPAIAITLLIPLLSLINPDKLPDASALDFAGLDKIIHMIMYAVLTIAWIFALPPRIHANLRWILTLVFLTSLYGMLLEICQFFFTVSRSMDMLDALANLAGAMVAAMAIYGISKLKSVDSSPGESTRPTAPDLHN